MSSGVRRGVLSVAIAGTVLAGSMVGAGFAQDGAERLADPGADALADPVIQEQVASEHQAAAAAEKLRQTPEEIAARERSRSAYQDLSTGDARRLALDAFPDLLVASPTDPLELPPGAEVEQYYGTYAALIDPPGADVDSEAIHAEPGDGAPTDPGGVLQSTTPLRAEDEQGVLRPIDAGLIDRGSYREPSNATVEAELPDDLAQGVALPELDLSFAPAGAAAAAPGELAGDESVFYGDLGSGEDVDFLVGATPTGAEALWQLRSAESPERLALDLELPGDARLESTFGGRGARIVRDGETTAIVTPPIAFDADGQSVPVNMSVAASALELTIEHRAGDYKYPLMVDPVIEYWFWANQVPDTTGWYWEDSCADPCNRFNKTQNFYVIGSESFHHTFYWQSEYAQWVFPAPPYTYVEQAEFWWQEHGHSPGDSACTVQGIYDRVGFGWQLGYAWVDPGGWAEYPGTPYVRCNPYSVNVVSQGVGRHLGDNGGGDPIGADENAAVFQLFMDYSKERVGAYNFMRQANIHLYDRYDPAFTTAKPASQGWRDDSLSGGATQQYSRTIGVSDTGLGVKHIDLWIPNAQGVLAQNRQTHPCTGAAYAPAPNGPCPGNWQQTFQYTLPEGRNELSARGWDLGWRYTPGWDYIWQQPIDRSPPTLDIVGELTDDDFYDLDVTATDGSTTAPANERSGVSRIEVFVDGASSPLYAEEQECPAGSCGMVSSWEVPTERWTRGPHQIRVIAKDRLGHSTTKQLTPTSPLNTNIETGPRGTVASRSASFSFTSPDPATFECRVDGAAWAQCESPLSLGGLSEGRHVFEVRAVLGSDRDPTPAVRSWFVDTVSPQTVINSAPSSPTSSRTATIAFSSNRSGSTFECRWESESWEPCTSPAVRSDLADGQHGFAVRATSGGVTDPSPAEAAWRVDGPEPAPESCDPAAGQLAAAAIQALQQNSPAVVAPSQASSSEGQPVDPSLAPPSYGSDDLLSIGTLTDSRIPCDIRRGFELETAWGQAKFTPAQVAATATEAAVVNEDSAVFANTSVGADSILRPTAQGVTALTQIRLPSAQEQYAWRVSMAGGIRLRVLDDGSIAFLADTTPVTGTIDVDNADTDPPLTGAGSSVLMDQTLIPPESDGSLVPPPAYAASGPLTAVLNAAGLRNSVPAVNQQLTTAATALSNASQKVGSEAHLLLAVMKKPWAVDANGTPVPVSLSVDRDLITMTVDHSGGSWRYPIVADPDLVDCENRPNPCGNFEPASAMSYAFKWRTGRNGNYPAFNNDCTNFVSQVLKAGRMQFSREYEHGEGSWWVWKRRVPDHPLVGDFTHSWSVAHTLQHHLREYGLVRVIPDGKRDWKRGDIMFYRWRESPSEMSHTNVVYSVSNGTPNFLQHTRDYNSPKSLKEFRARVKRKYGGIAGKVHLRPIKTRADIPE